jgi:O-antigen ligase
MESNILTSGGFGPNQVSAVLGFAVLIAFLYVVSAKVSILTKLFLVGAAAVFAAQSAMTFSRAGLASAAIALMVSLPFLITDRRRRIWTVAGIVALVLAGVVLFPVLNSYTGGKLQKRFEETSLSNREALAAQDLDLFQQNPLYGVGVGLSVFLRPTRAAAHTEFTRLLADHGLLGAIALLALVLQLGKTLLTARTHWVLGLRAAAVSWTLLNFAINAMRLVAPSYALCVAFVNLEESADHGTPVSSHVGQG